MIRILPVCPISFVRDCRSDRVKDLKDLGPT